MQPKEAPAPQIQPSRFEDSKPLRIAGLKQRLTNETMKDIPALWQRFIPHFGKVPGQVGNIAYGLCSRLEMKPFSFDYLAGVEVSGNSKLPEGFSHVDIPALHCVVFPHNDHVSKISQTVDAIWHRWLPSSGYAPIEANSDVPYMFERYGEGFNPQTETGDIEIWIPLQA
jgi:AraC family transcriptional regulator